jgi:serpin B
MVSSRSLARTPAHGRSIYVIGHEALMLDRPGRCVLHTFAIHLQTHDNFILYPTYDHNERRDAMKRSTSVAGLGLLAVALSLVVSAEGVAEEGNGEALFADTTGMISLVSGNTEFALALYDELRASEGNLFLSPYSISSALAMTYAGARGNTASQMRDVLGFELDDDRLHAAFGTLTDGLNLGGETGDFELSVANALWGQRGYRFLDEFIELNQEYYGAAFNTMDFLENTEGARQAINAWVEEETREKIRDLIKPGVLSPLTTLVLTNAIYFKGSWASRFDKGHTSADDFRLSADTSVSVEMMHQTQDFGYMETKEFQGLELPYSDHALSMLIFLPREIDGLDDLERTLAADSLRAWSDGMHMRRVRVSLPKFSLTCEFDLSETLSRMGMMDAFRAGLADFSGMTGVKDLWIDLVLHKAFVDVYEEGTEVAAATAVLLKRGPGPANFRADHPFLFMIRDNASGSILFMGRLVNPNA